MRGASNREAKAQVATLHPCVARYHGVCQFATGVQYHSRIMIAFAKLKMKYARQGSDGEQKDQAKPSRGCRCAPSRYCTRSLPFGTFLSHSAAFALHVLNKHKHLVNAFLLPCCYRGTRPRSRPEALYKHHCPPRHDIASFNYQTWMRDVEQLK